MPCRFCGVEHKPCDADYCYCAPPGGVPNEKGEGWNEECDRFPWGLLAPTEVS